MRKIASALTLGLMIAQLLTTSVTPSYAAGLTSVGSTGEAARMASPVIVRKSKKASTIKIKIDPMSNVRRGQTSVPVKATVPQSGLTCQLELKYYGSEDSDSPDNVTSDGNGICLFHFDAPKGKDVVGDAKATVKVYDAKGKRLGEASANFDVR